ncbi:MAG: hypothetical protein H6Q73_2666 [Firmicutes bacterium]|nr:hypothetical protein [Bacillota bacterium]
MRRLSILIIILLILSAVSCVNANSKIAVSYLAYHSRYALNMKDISGKRYMVYIFSTDEKKLPSGVRTWFNETDQVFRGNYYAAIAAHNGKVAVRQNNTLFGFEEKDCRKGTLNICDTAYKNRAYVVRSKYEGQPDILIVTQQLTGNGDANIRAFYVENGSLHLINWQNNAGAILKFTSTSGINAVKNLESLIYKTDGWVRSVEYTGRSETTWKFDQARRTMVFTEQTLLNKTSLEKDSSSGVNSLTAGKTPSS